MPLVDSNHLEELKLVVYIIKLLGARIVMVECKVLSCYYISEGNKLIIMLI